jgi:site-specific recombinase XerD
MPRREQKVIQVLSAQQIDLLMRVAETTRDKAILAVLLDCGLRVNELCTLNLQNVHFTPQDAWLLVHGKRDKWREVGLGRKARRLLHTYIYRERHAPPNEAHVFLGKHGPLTASGIDQLLYRLRDEAGAEHFTGVRVSAHTMRHTFAVHYLSSGGELYKLSRLLGHTSVTTTDGYLRAFRARDARRNSESVLDSMW